MCIRDRGKGLPRAPPQGPLGPFGIILEHFEQIPKNPNFGRPQGLPKGSQNGPQRAYKGPKRRPGHPKGCPRPLLELDWLGKSHHQGPRDPRRVPQEPQGGGFCKPLLLGPGTFLLGAFYVTKKTDFLFLGWKTRSQGLFWSGKGPRARDQRTGPKGGPRDRDQGGTKGPGPRRDQGTCLLYTSPSPRDATLSRMPSSA